MKGLIFNIQKYCVNDGGGIRTVVFFKGCPLRCRWCSNPESQEFGISKMFWTNRCIGCGRCRQGCALGIGNNQLRWAECKAHMDCVKACPSKALEASGKWYDVEELLKIIEKDAMFYHASGGGVTLSGGEPLLQWEFARELLKECQAACMDTAMETTGYASYEHLREVAFYCNRLLYDVKHMDTVVHEKYTGAGNERILENLMQIRKEGIEVIIRVPLIHGVNDDWDNMEKTAKLAKLLEVKEIDLLPYHSFGEPKYKAAGKLYQMEDASVSEQRLKELQEGLGEKGLKIVIGG